ncbi:MAG: hypothetical protein NTW19_09525 [Planctomycetota bacterium]|nr:hypothetical protein [Planctomycetota bacterium]
MTDSNASSAAAPASPAAKPKRWVRWLLLGGAALLVLLLLIVLLIPTLLSTGAGTSFLVSTINGGIAGQVQIADASLGWFSGQKIHGLKVLDPAGKTIIDAPDVDLPGLSLFAAVRGSRNLGAITLNKARVDLVQDDKGQLNLAQAFAAKSPKAASPATPSPAAAGPSVPPDLSVKLVVVDGTVTYLSQIPPKVELVTFANVNCTLDLPNVQQISVSLKTDIAQGTATGSAAGSASVKDLFDAAGYSQSAKATLDADVKLDRVPVVVVSRLTGQGDALVALLGPSADMTLKAKGAIGAPDLNLVASSANLKANINAAVRGPAIDASNSTIALTVTEPAWQQWSKGSGQLLKPFDVNLAVKKLTIPRLDAGGVNLAGAAVDIAASVGDVAIDSKGELGAAGTLALRGTRASIVSDALGKSLVASLSATAQQGGQTGSADLKAEIKDALTADAKMDSQHMTAKVQGAIKTLPLALVDQLSGNGGMLAAVLGPSLDATIAADVKPEADGKGLSGTFSVNATAANLAAALNGSLTPDALTLADGSKAGLKLTPAGAVHFMGKGSVTKLIEEANIAATIAHAVVPLKQGKPDMGAVSIDVKATIDRLVVSSPDIDGNAVLRDAALGLVAERLDKEANLKLSAATDLNGQPGKAQAAVKATKLVNAAGELDAAGAVVVADALIEKFPSSLADAFAKRGNVVTLAAGPMVDNLRLHLEAQPAAGGKRDLKFEVDIAAPLLNANAAGSYINGAPKLTSPAHLTAKIQPALVALLTTPTPGPAAPGKPTPEVRPSVILSQPANLDLYVTSLEVAPGGAAAGLKLGLKGTIDQIVPFAAPGETQVALRNVHFTLPDCEATQKLEATLDAEVVSGSDSGAVTLRANVARPMQEDRVVDAWLTSSALPVALVDTLTGQRGKLPALLGEKLGSVAIIVGAEPAKPMTFSAKIDAERVKVDVSGQYLAGPAAMATFKPNSTASLLVTNEVLAALFSGKDKAPPALSVTQPAMLRVTLAQVEAAFVTGAKGKSQLDPAKTKFNVGLSASGLGLKQNDSDQVFDLKDVTATLTSADLTQLISLQASVAVAATAGGQTSTGSLASNTQVKGLKFKDGSPDTATATLTSKTTTKEMPVVILDTLLRQNGQLNDLFGATVSLVADVAYAPGAPGSIDLDVQSANTVANLKGTIDKDMVLHLREDLTASLKITPQLGARLLPNTNPLLAGAVSGDKPATLRIKKETFAAPLKNLSMQTLVADGTIELGKLKVEPTSPIVGGFFTALSALSPGAASTGRQIDAKFTPLTFKVADGALTSNDLWLETGFMTIGTQARVAPRDAQDKSLWADVVVAIPGNTLANFVPGLQIDRNRIFEIGATGPTSKVKPDYGKFLSTQIMPLLAAKGLTGKNAEYANLVGGLASGIGSALAGKGDKKGEPEPTAATWVNHTWKNRPTGVVAPQATQPATAPAATPATGNPATAAPAASGAKPMAPSNTAGTDSAATAAPEKKPSLEQSILGGIGDALRKQEEAKAKKKAEREKQNAASKPAEK